MLILKINKINKTKIFIYFYYSLVILDESQSIAFPVFVRKLVTLMAL